MSNVVVLHTGYVPEPVMERPVGRAKIASLHGVHPKTVDRWVARDGMPEDTNEQWGCWIRAGCQRRYYPTRVRVWLATQQP